MKRYISLAALALLLCAVGVSNNCIMEEKVIEIVVTDKTCQEMEENHDSANFVTPAIIYYAAEIDAILDDNDYSREDMHSARVMSVAYIVTNFSHTHDWTISGYIDVERIDISDGPATLFNYTSQSVTGAMGDYVIAPLQEAGVELINRALDDYIAGGNPVIRFAVHNGNVLPPPSPADPIVFNWRACIMIYVTTLAEVDAPDPF
ncbi:MAG TPA: hypothetical protein VMX58_12475 [Patescibacteria group bacterium]|nr:hypothetical protein [Patescibacteria group bacterium]